MRGGPLLELGFILCIFQGGFADLQEAESLKKPSSFDKFKILLYTRLIQCWVTFWGPCDLGCCLRALFGSSAAPSAPRCCHAGHHLGAIFSQARLLATTCGSSRASGVHVVAVSRPSLGQVRLLVLSLLPHWLPKGSPPAPISFSSFPCLSCLNHLGRSCSFCRPPRGHYTLVSGRCLPNLCELSFSTSLFSGN